MNLDQLSLLLAVITAVVTSIRWLYEYSRKQTWERNRFMLERLEIFSGKESVRTVQRILDWNKLKISVGEKECVVDDAILLEALQTHDHKHSFSSLEVHLRSIFDEYFDSLTEIVLLSDAGLIDEDKLRMFQHYWIEILSGKKRNKPSEVIDQMDRYLEFYGFDRLRAFIRKQSMKEKITSTLSIKKGSF